MILDNLAQAAREKCGLNRHKKVLVGVSGGADSLALMHGLHILGYPLVVAHLDHGLRVESAEEAEFVRGLADSLGLPFVSMRIEVRQVAEAAGQSLEEAARHVRYRFLFEQARVYQAQAVAVGHHADDQVETVVMHLLRGAALSGLGGMDYRRTMPAWDKAIPIVRPLLGVWRNEIEAYIDQLGWEARVDLSNQDTTYFRNRLRHELLPELATNNPRIREVLWRMADVLREEDRFLEDLVNNAWDEVWVAKGKGTLELNRGRFLALPRTLQSRTLRRAISLLRPDLRDVGYEALTRGLAFAAEPPQSMMIDLVAKLNLAVVKDRLIIKTWDADLPDWDKPLLPEGKFQAELQIGEPVAIENGWWIEVQVIDPVPQDVLKQAVDAAPNEAWLDADRLKRPLVIRSRKEGERWQPLGMGGHHQSFQDFFITQKVPEHLRDRWPLVCSSSEAAWVVRMRPSEAFKISAETQRVLRLKVSRVAENNT